MNLNSIKFTRDKLERSEWNIAGKSDDGLNNNPLTLENINLIVGKNASGKSRTIDAIRHVADLVSGEVELKQLNEIGLGTADYYLNFSDGEIKIEYILEYKNGLIKEEKLLVEGKEKLNRGLGKLWYEELNDYLDFQTDENVLAITKRDKKQHSFFENIYLWGKTLNHFKFGTQLGKDYLLRDINSLNDSDELDFKDNRKVAEVFIKGKEKFPDFVNTLVADMKKLSYELKDIDAKPLNNFPISAVGISVKENDIEEITDQRSMSQGMFRALSLLIQLNYSLLNKLSSCILIDDIGEGLDYDRSKKLIDLIIEKVKISKVQVLMTTNDRFVMNKIPIEYWSVIQRVPKKAVFYNYKNSKLTFDDFKYTGLNNFDFLSTEFYVKGFDNQKN